MTIQIIPTSSEASYTQQTTLEGSTYVLAFDFNQRNQAWYMHVADASNIDIYNGVKLMVGIPLMATCLDPRKPPGEFFVFSNTTDASPPGILDLLAGSGRCVLCYFTSDWLAQIKAGNSAALSAQLEANGATTPLSSYGAS